MDFQIKPILEHFQLNPELQLRQNGTQWRIAEEIFFKLNPC